MYDLLQEIERFIAANEIAPTAFGKMALNDGRFVDQLRKSRDVRASTVAKVRRFMAEYVPQIVVAECHGGDAVASHGDGDSDDRPASSTGLSGQMSREGAAA